MNMENLMSENTLRPILEKMKNANILVVGDIMLDRFVYGHADRISPESPVPVLTIKRKEYMLGGAGNVLSNLAGLEAQAKIISILGDDKEAAQIKDQVEKMGFESTGLITDKNRPTTVKSRFLASHQQLLRTDFESSQAINDDLASRLIEKSKTALKTANVVILSDYNKGVLRNDVIHNIIEAAKEQNIPVIIDPKGLDFSIYKGAYAITPNKKELAEAMRANATKTDEEIVSASQTLIDQCGIHAVVATRSNDGISVIEQNKAPLHIRTTDIEVFDVSGAGDTVIATIAASLSAGANLAQAASIGNIAGSIVVTKVGTAPIRLSELATALDSDQGDALTDTARLHQKPEHPDQSDILSWEDAAELVKRWKARGLKVGFTNGCFDILHYGHVSYLKTTRAHCDRLIVGLNKDSSIKILKGPQRPVHDENARAGILAALGSTDKIVLFGADKTGDDNTAIALLETIKPDVYFKGGDYTQDQIPEAPTVRKVGGQIKIMPIYEGHSSTNSIAKIKGDKAA